MKRVTIIKEKLPEDLIVKTGGEVIVVVYPNGGNGNTYFTALKDAKYASIRGNVKFSTDGSNWSTSYENTSGASQVVYLKTSLLDGFTTGSTSNTYINTAVAGNIGDTSILIDLKNIRNCNFVFYSTNQSFLGKILRGDISDLKGQYFPSGGFQQHYGGAPILYGDITGVGNGGNFMGMRVDNMFGDLAYFLSFRVGTIYLYQTNYGESSRGQFTCSPMVINKRDMAFTNVDLRVYLDSDSLYNLITAYADQSPSYISRMSILLYGDVDAKVASAATELKSKCTRVSINLEDY